jgi:hypothetical protein
MSADSGQLVYFHVGLGKAASTFLQYAFFPKLQGIRYLQRTRYRQAPAWLARQPAGRYLISREFDQQLERECTWFRDSVADRPGLRIVPVVVLRRQDGWFASQYRRHIKNGSALAFREFIDARADQGLWKLSDGFFLPKLLFLERCFGQAPVVLLYEDLRADPAGWLRHLASQLGAAFDPGAIRLDNVHASYSEHQLLVMRQFSRRWFPNPIAHGQTSWLARRARLLSCYAVLYAARLLPARRYPGPLIPPAELAELQQVYEADWEEACRYSVFKR